MIRGRIDPRLEDLLADSLVRAMMRADHVEPDALETLMHGVADRLATARIGEAKRSGSMGPLRVSSRLCGSAACL
jgi:hypothetical protein